MNALAAKKPAMGRGEKSFAQVEKSFAPTPTTEELRARDYPEDLLDLLDQWAARFVAMGETEARARELAFAASEVTRESIGGEQLYIPKGRYFALSVRDRELFALWNGQNTHLLCQKYDVTERHIYRIVEAMRKEEQERRQGKLF